MIRKGTIEDAEILSKVEATCFPPNEAATSKEIQERLNVYANHFLLLFEKNQLICAKTALCSSGEAAAMMRPSDEKPSGAPDQTLITPPAPSITGTRAM